MEEAVWTPDPEQAMQTNVARLMRRFGCDQIDELRELSVEQPATFWDAVVDDLQIPFAKPYTRTFDDSAGIEWTRWFDDGQINLTSACVDRWLADPQEAARTALIAEAEDGSSVELTYAQLAAEVDKLSAALRAVGVGPGDAIAVFMPMIAEAVIAAFQDSQPALSSHGSTMLR
ncbi:MAG: AMP-binding protein [Solirubrobacterales bacterium]|nr:AMP-binding protein [Solirubrobacterales bacterium]